MQTLIRLYGIVCYGFSMLMFVGFILWGNNHLGWLGVTGLEQFSLERAPSLSTSTAILVNVGLLLLFGIQHSVMARGAFKRRLEQLLPRQVERSTYCLATGVVIYLIIRYWQPVGGSLWQFEAPSLRVALESVYFAGWAISIAATFMLNHWHLFGLQQTFAGDDPDAGTKVFSTPLFYRLVRHPIQTGVVIAMLATPDMSATRAILALGMLVYVAIGLYFEERDLVAEFGETYENYRNDVPGVLPIKLR